MCRIALITFSFRGRKKLRDPTQTFPAKQSVDMDFGTHSASSLPLVLIATWISTDTPIALMELHTYATRISTRGLGPRPKMKHRISIMMKSIVRIFQVGAKCSLPEVHDRTMALRRSVLQVARTLREASAPEYEALGPRCATFLVLHRGMLYGEACR